MNIQKLYKRFQEERLALRDYPYYRILERSMRVGVIGLIGSIGVQLLGPSPVAFKAVIGIALAAGVDKAKNEFEYAIREYDYKAYEALKSLFRRD